MTTQDVRSIVDGLRAEVMLDGKLGERFADLLEDDRIFVDSEVGRLARQRGIRLDGYTTS